MAKPSPKDAKKKAYKPGLFMGLFNDITWAAGEAVNPLPDLLFDRNKKKKDEKGKKKK
jgi:hypothetical protein